MIHDRPTAAELADAVRHFLEAELLPITLDDRVRFRLLVSINALGVVQREIECGSMSASVQDSETLVERLGEDSHAPDILPGLKLHVAAKLEVVNPRYLARYQQRGTGGLTT